MRSFLLLCFLCLLFSESIAQIPTGVGDRGFGGRNSTSTIDTAQGDVELDTFKVFYYFPLSFYKEKAFSDSLLSNFTHHLDPARRRAFDYQNLGIEGSAAQPFVYQGTWRQGLDIGFHQFDIYTLDPDSIPFYRIERPFTNIEYDRGGDQTNSRMRIQFSRNFAKGVNLTLDYLRLAQLGSRIQFPNQQTRNTALGIGARFQNSDGRYVGYLTFTNNKNEQDDNGGLLAEPALSGGFVTPASAVVRTESANTEHRRGTYKYTHFYNLRKPEEIIPDRPDRPVRRPLPNVVDTLSGQAIDSLKQQPIDSIENREVNPRPPVAPTPKTGIFNKQEFRLGHSISYQRNVYKFFDDAPESAGDFYETFLLDDRGLRHFIQHSILENRLMLLTYKPGETANQEPSNARGLLELGLTHKLHQVEQEPVNFTVNNLFLTGRWHYLPTEFLRLETYGHLGILDNIGDFRAEAKLLLQLGKLGTLTGKFVNQLSEPSLIHRQLFVSQRSVWNNPLQKILETNLEVTYAIPSVDFSVTGAYHLINNMVYYDSLAVLQQSNAAVNIAQLIVKKNFDFLGNFHLDNQVVVQTSSQDFVRIPDLFGKHSLYYQGKWFNQVLDTRIGVDVRYTSAFFSDTYHPVVGDFILQNQQEIPFQALLDVYLSFRISKFRAYAKFENIRNLILPEQDPNRDTDLEPEPDLADINNWVLHYPTSFYPFPNATGFRLGIRWRFTE